MGGKLTVVESDGTGWNAFVRSTPDGTSYHQYEWKNVITTSFGHRCHYLAAVGQDGAWQGVLPLVEMRSAIFGHFMVSLPFVNYGGLLCRTEAAASLLLEEAERLRRSCGAAFVELRHMGFCRDGLPAREHKVTMILELADHADSQWKGFKSEIRNRIRKAEKSQLEPSVGRLELLDDFYGVFARNMRDLGTPVLAKRFFHNLLDAFPDTTSIFTVRHQGRTIGAAVAVWYGDMLEFPWVSSIREYRALCPNNMLYWAAIKHAIAHGFRKFDFGRSTFEESHAGTYNFKKQWGAQPVQLYWQYLVDSEEEIPEFNSSNPKYQTAIRIWQHLPVPLTKLLGPMVVRSIP